MGKVANPKRGKVPGKKSGIKPDPAAFSYDASDDRNTLALIELVRKGVAFSTFQKVMTAMPFSMPEWANYLQISERTIQRHAQEGKNFGTVSSERIIELSMLYRYGVTVFGDKDNFNVWLTSRSVALGGRTPKELLDTQLGIQLIRDELGRIEHGIFA